MKTKVIKISSRQPSRKVIAQAAAIIRAGGLVAFPTETVYGLGANALDKKAVRKIFKAKERPADNPLIVHIANYKDLDKLVLALPHCTRKLIHKFWPGPLTLVFRKRAIVPDIVTAGGPTVAIRMPDHPVALALIKEAGTPLAAPSANRAGRVSATSGQDVLEELGGKIELILDAGPTKFGLESTVLDISGKQPCILRPGAVTKEALEKVLKAPVGDTLRTPRAPRSPGMKYSHYAPRAKLLVIPYDTPATMIAMEQQLIARFQSQGKRVGILATLHKTFPRPEADAVYFAGHTLRHVSKNFFRGLRLLDKKKIDVILAEAVPERDLGTAIMNRLRKASANLINAL